MAQRTIGPTRLNRSGFTLIEMIAVILIIGVLAALILPAISSVRRSARNGAVAAELNQLASAINQFRNTYGVEPPSSIVIYSTQAGWLSDPTSTAKIRRMWPNFDFSMSSGVMPSYFGTSTVNGFPASVLTGAECLVFFLGGIVDPNQLGSEPLGFSKNPANPFAPPMIGETREGPYFGFRGSRFMDFDGDRFWEYRDSIPSQQLPIIYISSYEGQGYVFTDLIVSNNTGVPQPYNPLPTALPGEVDMTFPYSSAGALPWQVAVAARRPLNGKSFQLISPGMDFIYGTGGTWAEGVFSNAILADVQPSGYFSDSATAMKHRGPELDNITNFSTGTMGGR